MSEFTFSCPSCKQNIACNTTVAGERINCPSCLKLIVVPPVPTTPSPIAPLDKPGTTTGAVQPTPSVQKTSGLAIASLICSLASVVTCIGWIPGIICGHIAKIKIRRNPALKGGGIATAGLVIGYLFLLSEVSYVGVKVLHFTSAVKQGFVSAGHELATNPIVITETTNDMTATDDNTTQPEPAPDTVVSTDTTTSADPNWTTDPDKMSFPDGAVSGKVHGNDFQLRRAVLRPAFLRIVSANRLTLEIHGLGDAVGGKSFEVRPTDAPAKIPHIQITWPEGVLEPTAVVTHGYAMKLQFGPAANGTIPGKIYLCLPDNSKSWAAGAFKVQMLTTN